MAPLGEIVPRSFPTLEVEISLGDRKPMALKLLHEAMADSSVF